MPSKCICILGFLCLIACDTKETFTQFKPVANHEWVAADQFNFFVDNTDTISERNVFIHIRTNQQYAFNALFLIAGLRYPDGKQVVDTLQYTMTDAAGNILGTGFGGLKEHKLFYKEKEVFKQQGTYRFQVQHATRGVGDIKGEKPLQGIVDVGLSIESID